MSQKLLGIPNAMAHDCSHHSCHHTSWIGFQGKLCSIHVRDFNGKKPGKLGLKLLPPWFYFHRFLVWKACKKRNQELQKPKEASQFSFTVTPFLIPSICFLSSCFQETHWPKAGQRKLLGHQHPRPGRQCATRAQKGSTPSWPRPHRPLRAW